MDHPEVYNGTADSSLRSTSRRFTEDGRFVALYGQEFSTISSGNHASIFEIRDVIRTADVPNGAWKVMLDQWIPAHLDEDGREALILLNHPATAGSPNSKEYGSDDFSGDFAAWRTALDGRARLINIINGPSHRVGDPPGAPSEKEFLRYLNLGFHFAPTADQDNHRANWGDAAETRTAVLAPVLTRAAILEALRERHVYATQDNLEIIARINDHLIGTRVTGSAVPAVGSNLQIQLEIRDTSEPDAAYRILVYSDTAGGDNADVTGGGGELEGNGSVTISDVKYRGGAQYIFLKVIQQTDDDVEGEDLAWTAPVWFEPGGITVAVGPAITSTVDPFDEEAEITNIGTNSINLKNWTLVSVKGNQRFKFTSNLTLQPGKTVTVTSGSSARNTPPQFVRWTTGWIWSNDGDDPGNLLDPAGNLVAESP